MELIVKYLSKDIAIVGSGTVLFMWVPAQVRKKLGIMTNWYL